MKVFVALFALVSVASASSDLKDFLTTSLVEEKCYGAKYTYEKIAEIRAAVSKCHLSKPAYSSDDLFALKGAISQSERLSQNGKVDPSTVIFDDETVGDFVKNFDKVKENKVELISNLTCVMKELKIWKEDNSVNIDYITGELLKKIPFDDDMAEMFRAGMKSCYKFSEALPIEDEKNPIKKMFGKQMFFQTCISKKKFKLCTTKILAEQMIQQYGEITDEQAAAMGIFGNKYEKTIMAKSIILKTEPKTSQYVYSFLMKGKSDK